MNPRENSATRGENASFLLDRCIVVSSISTQVGMTCPLCLQLVPEAFHREFRYLSPTFSPAVACASTTSARKSSINRWIQRWTGRPPGRRVAYHRAHVVDTVYEIGHWPLLRADLPPMIPGSALPSQSVSFNPFATLLAGAFCLLAGAIYKFVGARSKGKFFLASSHRHPRVAFLSCDAQGHETTKRLS